MSFGQLPQNADCKLSDRGRWSGVLSNYAATMLLVIIGLWFYSRGSEYHSIEFHAAVTLDYSANAQVVTNVGALIGLSVFYALVLLPYYALRPAFNCDARKVISYAYEWASTLIRPTLGDDARCAMLTLLLKFIFVPLMVSILINNINEVMEHWRAVVEQVSSAPYLLQFNSHFYFLVLSFLFAIDVLIFTLGYLIEIPVLDNEIKSVDPTVLGWCCCLICYWPFNQVGYAFFGWQSVDFTDFGTPLSQSILAYSSLVAAAVFTWASIALGLRASNLTNRGIVCGGPYRWVRHPAYAAKNVTVWIAALPAIAAAFSATILDGVWVLACLAAWTVVYVLRALTEERHLLTNGNGYAEYMDRVRFRFVRGVV